jgi:Ran GTPase-activating protein (RanGAP) involved in mRNA processing and transport
MTLLGLDDKFALAFAKSLNNNTSLETVNLESNKIGSEGIPALIAALGKSNSILEMHLRHQKKPMGSAEEETLFGLFESNTTCVKLGLDLRSMLAQSSLERKLAQNRELARIARTGQNSGKKSPPRLKGAGKMQDWFAKIAANDPSVTAVDLVGDILFLSMRTPDRLAAAASFASNTLIRSVKLNLLELDDEFAQELAKAIKKNTAIEKLSLEQNDLRGDGIKAIVGALATNTSLVELALRHQKKPMDTAAEEALAGLMEKNTSIVKLGLNLRSSRAQIDINNILKRNREIARKARVAANK